MQMTVTHALLRDDGLSECLHLVRAATQDHRLHAPVMVQMGVHCRHGEFVVIVLQICQPGRELALVVVVDIAERRDTDRLGPFAPQGAHEVVSE